MFFQRRAGNTVSEALYWLRNRSSDHPFFAWLHFYDPHAAYDPPEQYRRPEPDDAQLSAGERKRRLYYDEATYMDAEIGRLLRSLEEMGLYENLLVVVVADHRELLGEHGRPLTGHSNTLVDATIQVPLLVRVPGASAPRVSAQQVQIIDIFPTILEATGLPVPQGVEGRSLLDVDEAGEGRPAYTEAFYEFYPKRATEGNELVSMRLDGWKLVTRPGREELYDLLADPWELQDVSEEHPDRVALLRQELRQLARRWPTDLRPAYLELSDGETQDHLERLRGLGYAE